MVNGKMHHSRSIYSKYWITLLPDYTQWETLVNSRRKEIHDLVATFQGVAIVNCCLLTIPININQTVSIQLSRNKPENIDVDSINSHILISESAYEFCVLWLLN